MDANRQNFAKRFEECKKYYQNKIQDLKGSEKAQVAKEHSLMEKLNQVLEKSVTEKESKIEELRNELGKAQKENQYLRNKNQELSQVRFLIVMHRLCAISSGPYHMEHIISSILYGTYHMVHMIWSISTANLKKYFGPWGSSNEGASQTKIRDYRVDNNCNRKRKIDEISSTV